MHIICLSACRRSVTGIQSKFYRENLQLLQFGIIALHYTVIVYNSGGYKNFIITSIDFYMIVVLYLCIN